VSGTAAGEIAEIAENRNSNLHGRIAMSQHDRWEYKSLVVETHGFWSEGKVDSDALDGEMAKFGDSGWELSAVVPISSLRGGTSRILFTFKRIGQSGAS
jgi:hypothetical protein